MILDTNQLQFIKNELKETHDQYFVASTEFSIKGKEVKARVLRSDILSMVNELLDLRAKKLKKKSKKKSKKK